MLWEQECLTYNYKASQWNEQSHNSTLRLRPFYFFLPLSTIFLVPCLSTRALSCQPGFEFWFCHRLDPQKYFTFSSITFLILKIRVIIVPPCRVFLLNFTFSVYHYNFLAFTLNFLAPLAPLCTVLALQNHNPSESPLSPFSVPGPMWLSLRKLMAIPTALF